MGLSAVNIHDPNGSDINHVYEASGEKTGNSLIDSGAGVVGAVVVMTDGANDAELVIYDNVAASGKVVARCWVKGSDKVGGQVIPFRTYAGMYCTITGAGAKYQVYYLS